MKKWDSDRSQWPPYVNISSAPTSMRRPAADDVRAAPRRAYQVLSPTHRGTSTATASHHCEKKVEHVALCSPRWKHPSILRLSLCPTIRWTLGAGACIHPQPRISLVPPHPVAPPPPPAAAEQAALSVVPRRLPASRRDPSTGPRAAARRRRREGWPCRGYGVTLNLESPAFRRAVTVSACTSCTAWRLIAFDSASWAL